MFEVSRIAYTWTADLEIDELEKGKRWFSGKVDGNVNVFSTITSKTLEAA
jgi:hypothetical protein